MLGCSLAPYPVIKPSVDLDGLQATGALRLRLKLRLHQPIVGDLYAFLKHSRDPGPAGDLPKAPFRACRIEGVGEGVGLRV